MMTYIVPLAGPDFVLPDGSLKPMYPLDGAPLIDRALTSRPWVRSGEVSARDFLFVLRETPSTAGFQSFLRERFPGCRTTSISDVTRGALLSALAGAALVQDPTVPVCVDLVDILYTCDFAPGAALAADPAAAGFVPWFPADSPAYSYLEIVEGTVRRTAEKVVISQHASAGTYFFRDMPTFLEAAGGALAQNLVTRNAFFLCPVYNVLIGHGKVVRPVAVSEVTPVSAWFHGLKEKH